MPICEVCGEPVEIVYKCIVCGILFCEDCGYPEEEICILCDEEEEEDVEEDREVPDVI